MEIKGNMVKLDKPATEIHIYIDASPSVISGTKITKASQDKLNRVYIRVAKE